ncbi:lumazine-binding domain protein [Mycobacterium kansasii]|uniref:Lumazine-binding domain protein n=1 Tax=Mycobacterium kansasii TaxID=1768 RepID=A0A1V3XH58_MYCKA|nr:lumazine-binding domain protein [Mycobacterium kansasii]
MLGQPPGWPPAPGPRKNRKPLWVTLGAGGAVLVVVAIVLVITLAGRGGPGRGGSAGDAVKGYLQALARGDAEAALSYGADQPATKELLTEEILKKQIAQWPISNIRILSDDSTGAGAAVGFGQVHVVVNFGDKVSDTTLSMKKDHGSWKLPSAAIKVKPGLAGDRDAAGKTVTFFGTPVGDSTVYVFPGWIDVGTTNPYITVTAKPILLDQVSLISETWIQPTFVLSDKGRDAARDQLAAAMANCQKSNLLAPPGCPMSVDPYGLADGTAAWGPADISAVKFDSFDPYRLALMFFGEVKEPIAVRTTGGATKQGEASQFLSGTADLAKTPPELNFR